MFRVPLSKVNFSRFRAAPADHRLIDGILLNAADDSWKSCAVLCDVRSVGLRTNIWHWRYWVRPHYLHRRCFLQIVRLYPRSVVAGVVSMTLIIVWRELARHYQGRMGYMNRLMRNGDEFPRIP